MAKLDHLFDSARGKLGNLVFYKVGGSGRVRMRAAHFRDQKSPAQLAQRQRLQVANVFLKPFRELIRITFAAEAVGRSAMQAAQSFNMRNALAGEYPDIHVEKTKARLSRGPLPVPVSASLTVQPEGLLIEWVNGGEAAGPRAYDTLVVIALSAEKGRSDYRFTEARRSDGRYVWKSALSGGNDDIWIAFRDKGQTEFSDSVYLLPQG